MLNDNEDILVVDDEVSVVEVVSLYLKREGFAVRQARTGLDALTAIQTKMPALVVLDVMLPGQDGLEIVRRLRAGHEKDIPIILLTARSQETDRIYGLEMGADDYVTKPFSPAELVARVKAVLRRTSGKNAGNSNKIVQHGDLTINPSTRQVMVRGKKADLTATEFNLLYYLASNPNHVFSRDKLLEHVWGFSDYVDPSTVTVHIRRLREKIEIDPSKPQRLLTVWGVGYRFEEENG